MTTGIREALNRLADELHAALGEAAPTPRYRKVYEVALHYRCSQNHIRELCKAGKLPCTKTDPTSSRARWIIDATALPDRLP